MKNRWTSTRPAGEFVSPTSSSEPLQNIAPGYGGPVRARRLRAAVLLTSALLVAWGPVRAGAG